MDRFPPRSKLPRRLRLLSFAVALVVVAGGCSSLGSQADRRREKATPTSDTVSRVDVGGSKRSDGEARFAYQSDDGVHVILGETDRMVDQRPSVGATAWLGTTFAFTTADLDLDPTAPVQTLHLYDAASATHRRLECGCEGVVAAGDRFRTLNNNGQQWSLSPGDARSDLPPMVTLTPLRATGGSSVATLAGDGASVLAAAPETRPADGTQWAIWRVGADGRAERLGADLGDNAPDQAVRSSDGSRLWYVSSSFGDCYHPSLASINLRTGEVADAPPLSDKALVSVHDLFIAENQVHPVVEIARTPEPGYEPPPLTEENQCETPSMQEVYRLEGEVWQQVDAPAALGTRRNGAAYLTAYDPTQAGAIGVLDVGGRRRRVPGRILYLLSCPPDDEAQARPYEVPAPGPAPATVGPQLSDRWVAVLDEVLGGEDPAPALQAARAISPSAQAVGADLYRSLSPGYVYIIEPGPFIEPDQVIRYCDRVRREPKGSCTARRLSRFEAERQLAKSPASGGDAATPTGQIDGSTSRGSEPAPVLPTAENAFGLYDRRTASAAEGRWIAQLAARPIDTDPTTLRTLYDTLNASMPGVELFRSDDWQSFNNAGFWVIYHPGPFNGPDDALAFCRAKGRPTKEDCYTRILSHDLVDRPRFRYPA